MRAAVIDAFKMPGSLREISPPELESDSVLIRITCAGVNPVDWKVRDGEAGKRKFPLTLGQDFAGTVERTGERVSRVAAGDRVFGCARDHGSYAEFTAIRDGQHDSPFAKIPQGVSDEQAAALPTPGLTALASLEILGVASGTRVLIVGAAGAVGSAAVQIARSRDAHVTAIVRPEQVERVRGFGAEDVVASSDDLVGALDGDRVAPFDAVLDLVSDADTLKKHASLIAKGGKLVTTIHDADEAWFRQHDITATNVVMNDTPQSSPQGLDELTRMVTDGRLIVEVADERPLADAAAVLDDLKDAKLRGKAVLRV